jgi:hypothetical protein
MSRLMHLIRNSRGTTVIYSIQGVKYCYRRRSSCVVKDPEYYTKRKTKHFIISKLIIGAEINKKHFLK